MRKILLFMFMVALVPAFGQESELLQNPSFEEATENSLFGYSYSDWSVSGIVSKLNKTDKLEGQQSLQTKEVTQTSNWVQQAVNVQSEMAGDEYEVRVCYKILGNTKGTAIRTDHYWDVYPSGRSKQDSLLLSDTLSSASLTEWKVASVRTKMPAGAHYFHFRVSVGKGMEVLLDDMSFHRVVSTEPYLNYSPQTLSAVSTEIQKKVDFEQIRFVQANLSSATSLYITGSDAKYFSLSTDKLENGETKVTVSYLPTVAGNHSAMLNIDNAVTPSVNGSIVLRGSATDPSKQAVITVSPKDLGKFSAVAGEQQQKTFVLHSENCTENISLSVSHEQGAGFVVSSGLVARNMDAEVTVTFYPQEKGAYRSVLTIESKSATSVSMILEGEGLEATAETVDWQTEYKWGGTALKALDEHFDVAEHNKTLKVQGWQNVSSATARPWWGFDESVSPNVDGSERYAKATAYQYQKASTGEWEMTLVTPALDYKNAAVQKFSFRVMGENMPDTLNPTTLEVLYIDATDASDVYEQVLEMEIPQSSDENGVWRQFDIDLSGQANISDVFYMAFRYKGPNGGEGAVVYYIDDVSWGLEPGGQQGGSDDDGKSDDDGLEEVLVEGTDGVVYNVLGERVGNDYRGIVVMRGRKELRR